MWAAVFWVAMSCCLPLHAETEDERFLAGLREKRLFRVAEEYCRAELAGQKLSPAEQATLTLEYMLTLSQHAVYSPPAQRDALWQEAQSLATKFPAAHPRKLVVDLQAALVRLTQGELARQEAEASGAEAKGYEPAQQALRDATSDLEALAKRAAQYLAQLREPVPRGHLTADDVFGLQHQVGYQLARARRNQALCYPAGSDDRVAALAQAVEQLDKLATQVAAGDDLAWRVKIDQGICQRLLENREAAARLLAPLAAPDVPPEIQQQATAEMARLLVASRRETEALQLIAAARARLATPQADLEFAALEALVAQWKGAQAAQDKDAATRARDQAVAQLAVLENKFGLYWSRRGEWLVIGSAGSGAADDNLEILARTADARFLKGQFDAETVKLYDQAAQQARTAQDWKRHLELSYRAATVQVKLKEPAKAGQRMVDAAAAVAQHAAAPLRDQAAQVHWQGVELLVAFAPPSVPHNPLYARHVELFPTHVTAGDASLALGKSFEQRGDYLQAQGAYSAVPLEHPKFATALAGLEKAFGLELSQAQANAKTPEPMRIAEMAQHWRKLLAPPGEPLPRRFSDNQRAVALAGARVLIQHTRAGYAAAEELLTAALAGSPDAPAAWRNQAQALAIVAMAAQPAKRAEAEELIDSLRGGAPQQWLELLAGLTDIAAAGDPTMRKELAELQLKAVAQLKPTASKLEPAQQTTLARIEAAALAASGQRQAALAAYDGLVKAHPQSGDLLEDYAALLAAGEDKKSWTAALEKWRVLAQGSRPQTPRWYRAKYHVAELNYRLGNIEQARQLIRYLQVTPPGLKNTPLEREFAALLAKCEEKK